MLTKVIKMASYSHFASVIILLQCLMASLAMATVPNLSTDQFALLHFKDNILDPHNILANNWTVSTSVCNWIGVSCGIRHRRVTSLNLTNMNLTGTISPYIGNLSFLISLDLSENKFHGHLPKELEHLRRLRLIDFSFNIKLNGDIPSWLGNLHKLRVLIFRNNSFTGAIPRTLVNLSNLETLAVQSNLISGSIPSIINNMSSLRLISFYANRLSGSLPTDLCHYVPNLEWLSLSFNGFSGQILSNLLECSKLQMLSLSYNRFKGHIPTSIGNFTVIEDMFLGGNPLQGEIPKEIGNLQTLKLFAAENIGQLSGVIPSSMMNISSLESIFLFNNSLSGILPDDICVRLPKLNVVELDTNKFYGHIPSSIAQCGNLQILRLSENLLNGSIPGNIGNLTRLEEIQLQKNNLEGNMPNSLFNASMLRVLVLYYNMLSGPIPDAVGNLRQLEWFSIEVNNFSTESGSREWSFLSSMVNIGNLRYFGVAENPFLNGRLPASIGNLSANFQNFFAYGCGLKGNIPMEVGNLSSLMTLSLYNNELSGSIPPTIGRLSNIQGLFLVVNKLQGLIPTTLCGLDRLYYLQLSFNKLQGPLPTCLGNLTSLGHLWLDSNEFTSTIPSTLWNLKGMLELDLSSNYLTSSHDYPLDVGNMKALLLLNLSRNMLSGNISSSIGGIETMVDLDLSGNRLQGHIPESFGGLISLEILNLSNNDLSGVIPKSLEKLSYLKYLNVSFNRLEGEIPSVGAFKKFTDKSFMKNHALCGPPRFLVPPCKVKSIHQNSKITILKYVLPAIATAVIIIFLIIIYKKHQRGTNDHLAVREEDSLALLTWRRISRAELLQATNGFHENNLVGSGGFGSVYKGTLVDGMNVAVKVFNMEMEGAYSSFDIECEALRNIIHRNLVKVITCCSNIDFKALVFDFMPNGSLDKWLNSQDCFLDIVQRINIMIDVASALEYLHSGYPTPVIHRDLKPSNILLDQDMVAHVGDFGMAKILGEDDFMKQTMTLATIGYMAPEYGSAGIVSVKCDVYSYGILLIETFTSKRPTDEMFSEAMSMRHWVKRSLMTGVIDILDANFIRRDDECLVVKTNCVSSILELALNCSADLPEERKDMKDVVAALNNIKQSFLNNTELLYNH